VTRISLRPVSPADLAVIDGWAGAIGEEAPSRSRPLATGADCHDPAAGLFWYVVVADAREVGTVWIERLAGQSESRLGVFLGDPSDFGRGIGREALRLAVAEFHSAFPRDPISLHVRCSNERAIACYRAVGFEIVDSGTRVRSSGEEVAFHTMALPSEDKQG
jgi:RimJ/RimL family protein N-acetyltransferase